MHNCVSQVPVTIPTNEFGLPIVVPPLSRHYEVTVFHQVDFLLGEMGKEIGKEFPWRFQFPTSHFNRCDCCLVSSTSCFFFAIRSSLLVVMSADVRMAPWSGSGFASRFSSGGHPSWTFRGSPRTISGFQGKRAVVR